MSSIESARRRERYRQLSGTLVDRTRRRTVRILLAEGGAISETELAKRIAASATDSDDPSPSLVDALLARLKQRHLPELVDNGLAHWDVEDRTVTSTYHPMYKHHESEELLSADTLDALAEVLGNARRCAVLASFEAPGESSTRAALAHRVAAVESDGPPEGAHVEDVDVDLHHRHLPALGSVDLVEYDVDETVVTYRGPSELPAVLEDRTHRR